MAVQIRGRQVMDSTITAAKLVLSDSFNFSSGTVSVATPTADAHAASKGYVDGLLQGLHPKESVRVLVKSNVDISGPGASIDGVTMASKDRVALTSQTTASQNGIYVYNGGDSAMTRADDADTFAKLNGAYFFVREGTAADEGFVQTAELTSFSGQSYVQFSSAGNITAGAGLAKSGNTLSVNVDDSSIKINGDTLEVKAGGVTDGMLAGSISNGKLSNSSVTIAGSSVALGGSITAATILGTSDTDSLSEGSSNLYFSNARARAAISVTDSSEIDLSYNSGTGALSADLKNGSVANARLANSAITIAGSSVSLGGSITADAIAGAVSSATIENAQLKNSTVSFGGISLALGSSDATPAFDLTDATNYPASALSGTVSNAQLANSTISGKALGSSLATLNIDGNSGLAISSAYNGSAAETIKMDANTLSSLSGDIDPGNDKFIIMDADDSNKTKKQSISNLISKIAGSGLSDSSGVMSIGVDNSTIEVKASSNQLRLKDGGIGLKKLKFVGHYESFTGDGSTAGFDLAQELDLDFKKFFTVSVNGLLMEYADSPSSKDTYSIDNDGAESVGKITFGANLDNGDKVVIRYLA
ncbi:hypothetical protein [Altibacter sp.]|uniref:hypothetical protein n=1 Tax=Altibacter sp. TaxID=2024823 RepID=UPI0025BADBC1|nr:hypothetical protein [Altibacter sp.]